MSEACKSTSHECASKVEIENYKEEIVVEKENSIVTTKMENKKIFKKKIKKICSQQYESEKIKANKVNNELKVNIQNKKLYKTFKRKA